jgi:hypothetical protein
MSASGKFVTVLGCMDGRCQEKTIAYAKDIFGADFVDSITEPGMDKLLAKGERADWIKSKAEISAKGHGSMHALITGHCSCAGNPVSYEEHLADLSAAKDAVMEWGLFGDIRTAVFGEDWQLTAI